jgi:hypothetical protein
MTRTRGRLRHVGDPGDVFGAVTEEPGELEDDVVAAGRRVIGRRIVAAIGLLGRGVGDYVLANSSGKPSQCAGTQARTGAFASAIIAWGPSGRSPIGTADLGWVPAARRPEIWAAAERESAGYRVDSAC